MNTEDLPEDGAEPVTGETVELNPDDVAELEPAAPARPELSLTTKIVTIEGEQFSMPYDTPVEQVRENLRAIYPGIGTARPTKGTIVIEGVSYETLEFVKQAGTKGLLDQEPNPLMALVNLTRVPIGSIPDFRNVHLLRRGSLTFAEALDLPLFDDHRPSPLATGLRLCQHLEDLSAAAAGPALIVPGWSA